MSKPSDKSIQYTIRRVPEQTDHILREKAAEYGMSLNETALKVLQRGLGQRGEVLHHDLDAYAGTWVQEDTVDEALKGFEVIDEGMWS